MGQIQNAINQVFTSGLGASLAISHSPYVQGQRAIKEAKNITQTRKSALEVLTGNKEKKEPGLVGLTEAVIKDAKTLGELEKRYKSTQTLEPMLKKAYQGVNEAKIAEATISAQKGTYSQRKEGQEFLAGADIISEPEVLAQKSATQTLNSLKKAYESKRGILMSAVQRRNMAQSQIPTELL